MEQRIKVSKKQVELMNQVQGAIETAQKQGNIIFATILAGADIEGATLKSIDTGASELVVEVPDISPKEETAGVA